MKIRTDIIITILKKSRKKTLKDSKKISKMFKILVTKFDCQAFLNFLFPTFRKQTEITNNNAHE